MVNWQRSKIFLLLALVCALSIAGTQILPRKHGVSKIKIGASDTMATKNSTDLTLVKERFISIDNVCSWPNLTLLHDGTCIATIFNKPNHGLSEGDVECWSSRDGKFWEKRGIAAQHDVVESNRMNVAAGSAKNGDLIVLAAGWQLKNTGTTHPERVSILRSWISRSTDGGQTWKVDKQSFPDAEPGRSQFIPYGDIVQGSDGSLRVAVYALTNNRNRDKVSLLRSEDDGRSWKIQSIISDRHNETALMHLGDGNWIAVARGAETGNIDQFRSVDDGRSWQFEQAVTQDKQAPGHLLQLRDGRIVFTYGNRIEGQFGLMARISSNKGTTWAEPIQLVSDLTSRDCGYPASIELANGDILTAYYAAGAPNHHRYHMGSVHWKLPAGSFR